jgi:hypothetical protein
LKKKKVTADILTLKTKLLWQKLRLNRKTYMAVVVSYFVIVDCLIFWYSYHNITEAVAEPDSINNSESDL